MKKPMKKPMKKLIKRLFTERAARDSQGGFISMEMLGGLALLAILLPMLFAWVDYGIKDMQKSAVASHFGAVYKAARTYALSHGSALLPLATPTSGPVLSLDDLRGDGLLAAVNPLNAWGQGYQIYVRQPDAGDLRLVVLTTGGAAWANPDMYNAVVPSAAALAGAGYVPSGLLPGQNSNQLQGGYGAWTLDLPSAGIPSPGAGHLGALTDLSADDLLGDQLYRVSVPGKPELNEMWTVLDMTDHGITNVESIQFEQHDLADLPCGVPGSEGRVFLDRNQGLFVCRNGQAELVADTGNSQLLKAAMVVPNGLVTKPSCPPGNNPGIYLSPSILSAGATSPPLAAIQTWATNESATQWRVHLRVLRGDDDTWVYPGANYGRVMAIAICED